VGSISIKHSEPARVVNEHDGPNATRPAVRSGMDFVNDLVERLGPVAYSVVSFDAHEVVDSDRPGLLATVL
jgi:hypothetical protein